MSAHLGRLVAQRQSEAFQEFTRRPAELRGEHVQHGRAHHVARVLQAALGDLKCLLTAYSNEGQDGLLTHLRILVLAEAFQEREHLEGFGVPGGCRYLAAHFDILTSQGALAEVAIRIARQLEGALTQRVVFASENKLEGCGCRSAQERVRIREHPGKEVHPSGVGDVLKRFDGTRANDLVLHPQAFLEQGQRVVPSEVRDEVCASANEPCLAAVQGGPYEGSRNLEGLGARGVQHGLLGARPGGLFQNRRGRPDQVPFGAGHPCDRRSGVGRKLHGTPARCVTLRHCATC